MHWLDLLAVQGTLKSLLQHHSSKVSILRCSAFFIVQLLHPYMTTGETIALTGWTFVGKVMSLLYNMLSRLFITFLSRSKRLLISWLQSPSVTSYTMCMYIHTHINILYMETCACSVVQWYLPLCVPMDCSPPGSSVHEIFQARIQE